MSDTGHTPLVRVKPLEWEERIGVTGTYDAKTPIGSFIASVTDEGRGHWFIVGLSGSNYIGTTVEEAKAAAQADYERRILSAIELDVLASLQSQETGDSSDAA